MLQEVTLEQKPTHRAESISGTIRRKSHPVRGSRSTRQRGEHIELVLRTERWSGAWRGRLSVGRDELGRAGRKWTVDYTKESGI